MTQSQKHIREILSSARQAQLFLDAMESSRKLDRILLKSIRESEKSQNSQDHPENPENPGQLDQELLQIARIRQEVAGFIRQIPDLELRTILERRYLVGETMAQIAQAMNYDIRTIQRKHNKALLILADLSKS